MSGETVIISETPLNEGVESEVLNDDENLFEPEEEADNQTNEETEDDDDDDVSTDEDEDENIFEDEEEDDDDDDEEEEETSTPAPERVDSAQAQADAASAMLAAHGIDYNGLVDEFQAGGLSEKSMAALAKVGLSKDVVDSYIGGQQAKYDLYAREVQALAGGEKAYAKLCKWGAKNLSPEEQVEYDHAVESMDKGRAKFAVNALLARKQMATGKAPELVKAKASKRSGGEKPFNNIDDVAKALEDPRYGNDRQYTKMVDARLEVTPY